MIRLRNADFGLRIERHAYFVNPHSAIHNPQLRKG